MIIKMDTRSVFRAAFRQKWKFFAIFIPIVSAALLYILLSTPVFLSAAKFMVQFEQDSRPEITQNQIVKLTAEEKRGLIQSNLNIFRSRDLVEQLLGNFSLDEIYPHLLDTKDSNPQKKMDRAILNYMEDLQTIPSSSAGIIDVGVYHKNPTIALELLEKHVALFIERQSEFFNNAQTDIIREQTDKSLDDLQKANKELLDFKDTSGVTSIDEEITILLNKRSDITEYLTTYSEKSGTSLPLPAKKTDGGEGVPFPALDEAQKRISELRSQEQELLLTYNERSDVVQKVRENLRAEIGNLKRSTGALQDKLADLDMQIAKMNAYKSQYDILRRNVDLKEAAYERALSRMQAAEVNEDLNKRKITQIALIEKPSVPVRPAKPNKKLILLLSVVLAACIGGAIAIISELMDTRIVAADQISHLFKAPLLASYMYIDRFQKRHKSKLPVNDLEFLVQEINTKKEADSKIISVTSCNQNEGTSTLVFNLANYLSVSRTDLRILVIDDTKLTYFEAEEIDLHTATTKASFPPALYFLSFGEYKNRMIKEGVFAQISKNFDLVFITSSNLINDPISTRINSFADMSIFMIEAERTRYPVVQAAISRTDRNHINLIGFILNKKRFYIPNMFYNFIK